MLRILSFLFCLCKSLSQCTLTFVYNHFVCLCFRSQKRHYFNLYFFWSGMGPLAQGIISICIGKRYSERHVDHLLRRFSFCPLFYIHVDHLPLKTPFLHGLLNVLTHSYTQLHQNTHSSRIFSLFHLLASSKQKSCTIFDLAGFWLVLYSFFSLEFMFALQY